MLDVWSGTSRGELGCSPAIYRFVTEPRVRACPIDRPACCAAAGRAARCVVVVANSSAMGSSSALRSIPPDSRSRRHRPMGHTLARQPFRIMCCRAGKQAVARARMPGAGGALARRGSDRRTVRSPVGMRPQTPPHFLSGLTLRKARRTAGRRSWDARARLAPEGKPVGPASPTR